MRRCGRWFRNSLTAIGAIYLLVTLLPPRWYAARLAGPWNDPQGRVLIVLGADVLDGVVVGQGSYWRSVYAVRAWKEGAFERVILAGVPMRTFLVGNGVPEEAILVEGRSTSTRENALFTMDLLRKRSDLAGPYVLLTSDYHMWRARRAFAKAGLEVRPRPFPDAIKRFNDWRQRILVTMDLAVESAKICYYRARDWI
jgi:uncharacterized SAM-binding protein YcdF (DUF218 family)